MVSYYFQYTKRGDWIWANSPFNGNLYHFIRRDIGGIHNILKFNKIWKTPQPQIKQILHISYENLKTDTKSTIIRVMKFLGLSGAPHRVIDEAIEFCSL